MQRKRLLGTISIFSIYSQVGGNTKAGGYCPHSETTTTERRERKEGVRATAAIIRVEEQRKGFFGFPFG
jgi:hypothetical protein